MRHARLCLICLICLAGLAAPWLVSTAMPSSTSSTRELAHAGDASGGGTEPVVIDDPGPPVITRLTADEQATVAWVRSRFAAAGLDLPDVGISFHDRTEPCKGNQGLYIGGGRRPAVRVCVADHGTLATTQHRRRTLTHELAHVWEQANLDDGDRAELLPVLDVEGWYSPDAAWDERGAERLAETIVWGLYDQLHRPTLIEGSCPDLHADFRLITGRRALGPLEAFCELGVVAGAGG